MLSTKALNALGIPSDARVMPLALKLVNTAAARGADPAVLGETVRLLAHDPQAWKDDPLFGPLAEAMLALFPGDVPFVPRERPAPWRQWGDMHLDASAREQMENACSLPNAVRGVLMPDAHTGYGLPIGGVLAVKDAVIPYAVGVDIACRMRLSVLDMPLSSLAARRERFKDALEQETRFGLGSSFDGGQRRDHAVMDEDWTFCPVTARQKDKAWRQLGTSGGGNHFVEFGELRLDAPARLGALELAPGVHLALLSHSGSRGTGEAVANEYSKRAMALLPGLPRQFRHLAWLDLKSADGLEYWAAMELMGRYAAANHELIHAHILRALGAEAVTHVENHHNFAWREEYDGERVVVHRKGATPAGEGVQGIVPGSMAAPGFVVRGRGNADALNSCSHGAGRAMSRSAAFQELDEAAARAVLEEAGVELLSGGLDEAPMAYKDIHAVMAAQVDLVDILARFEPRLVKMAPADRRKAKWRRKGGKRRGK